MIRDIPPLAVEGVDPWEKVQIDPASRRLAEYAAAAAGLAVEEWLERAIRRACPSAFRTASVTIPAAPIVAPTFATPTFAAPTFAAAPAPRPVAPTPAPAAPPAQPPEIEASLAALLARARQQSQPRPSQPPVEARSAAPIEPPPLPPIASLARPAPLPPAPLPEPPAASRRPQTLAERLSRQRLDEAEEEAEPLPLSDERSDDRDWPDEENHAAPRMFAESEQDDAADAEPKRRFKLWAARDDAQAERAPTPRLVPAGSPSRRAARKSTRRLAFIGVGIALAVTAGAVTAQFLIPGNTHLPRLADASGSMASNAPIFSPTPSNPPPVPNFDSGNGAQSSSLPGLPSLPPASSSTALPDSSSADNGVPSTLPPVPGLPSLPSTDSTATAPSDSGAPTSLASLPPSPPPSALPSVALPPAPLPLPTPSTSAATPAPTPTPVPPQRAAKSGRSVAKAKGGPRIAAAPSYAPVGPAVTAAINNSKADGEAAPTDPKALAPWLEQRAKSGDVIAEYRLGVLYALGQGVQQDYQHAAQLFKTSAEGGVAEAQYNIAVMYGEGLGIGRDPNLAVQWYQKAAAQGNANAAFNLGVAYSNGVGVQQDMDQAAQWFRRAAAAGIINAQFNLGLLYERGDGVPVSQVEAYAWYSAAASHGDSGAAQRRDRLGSALAPSTLKEAQDRAQQIAATIQTNNANTGAGLTTNAAANAAAPAPLSP